MSQGAGQGKNIPAMPTLIPGELSQWMRDRQAGLQNAFADEDDVRIFELTSRMAKAAERLIQLTRQSEMSDDELALWGALGEGPLPHVEYSLSLSAIVSEAIGKQSRVCHQEFQIWFARL